MGWNFFFFKALYMGGDLIGGFNFLKGTSVVDLLSIKLGVDLVGLTTLEDVSIIKCMTFLEMISGRKPKVTMLTQKKNILANKTQGVSGVRCEVDLVGSYLYNFLQYMVFLVLPLYSRKYGIPTVNYLGNLGLSFDLYDLNVFYGLKGEYDFKGKLNVLFLFNIMNLKSCLIFLQTLGVYVNIGNLGVK